MLQSLSVLDLNSLQIEKRRAQQKMILQKFLYLYIKKNNNNNKKVNNDGSVNFCIEKSFLKLKISWIFFSLSLINYYKCDLSFPKSLSFLIFFLLKYQSKDKQREMKMFFVVVIVVLQLEIKQKMKNIRCCLNFSFSSFFFFKHHSYTVKQATMNYKEHEHVLIYINLFPLYFFLSSCIVSLEIFFSFFSSE